MKQILQMEPWFDEKERDALTEYMNAGGWVTEFQKTREFERMIAEFTGAAHCSVVSNGTVGLSVALMACGVGPGDEVIVPDYTMVATPNAAELIGARAVFADIDRDNLCMDFDRMAAAVTARTRAVMLVTINGRFPKDIGSFVSFCREKGLYLIEDAAQSLGSFCNGRHLGRYGAIGCFSFSAPKVITTGQGGALITDDPVLYDRILKIRDFGRAKGGEDHYLVKGWNFKFTDLQAVIGIEQMKKLPARLRRKKEMGRLYERLLGGIGQIELIQTDYDQTAPWFFDILCENREALAGWLKARGIGVRNFYPPLHAEPAYRLPGEFPVTGEISRKGLWLPSSSRLTDGDITEVCGAVRAFYDRHPH